MINNEQLLAAIFFGAVLPLLVLAFCCWRMVSNVLGRSPADARRRARHIAVYASVSTLIAGTYVIGGIVLVTLTVVNEGLQPVVVAFSAMSLLGVLSALSLIPAFTVVGQLRMLERDDQDQLETDIDRSTAWIERWGWTALLLAILAGSLMLGALLPIVLLILFLSVPTILWYRLRNREAQLLWLLSLAVRQRRDLAGELRHHASTWCGAHACRLRELAMQISAGRSLVAALQAVAPPRKSFRRWLFHTGLLCAPPGLALLVGFAIGRTPLQAIQNGLTLAAFVVAAEFLLCAATALCRFRGLLPAWCMTALQVGEECGTLEVALRECATEHLSWLRDRFRSGSPSGLFFYLSLLVLCGGLVTSFLFVFIVPKYRMIFQGFGVEMPKLSQVVFDTIEVLAGPLLFVLPVIPLLMVSIVLMDHLGWRNLRLRPLALFYRRYDAAAILRHLARTVEKGDPLTEGLRAMANSHHRPVIAAELASLQLHVDAGGDCWRQLVRRGFIGPHDLAVIDSAERTGNLAWALREVATTRERRLQYRSDAFLILLRPVAIILMGVVVGIVTVSMLLPVLKLINGLS